MDIKELTVEKLAATIDHTLLKPEATEEQIVKLCQEALEHHFASVCVNPWFVPVAVRELAGSKVVACTVCGFPLGATTSSTKAYEAGEAVWKGALEVDMVINIGAYKAGNKDYVREDIKAVVDAVKASNPAAITKVIIETCLLTDDEKLHACHLAQLAGASFVKTSTGFSTGGATVKDVALLKKTVGNNMLIKASGGIKDWNFAKELLMAGADRLGASAGLQILQGFRTDKNI